MSTAYATHNHVDTGRFLDWAVTSQQIDRWTVAAISGGRVDRVGPSAVDLPIRYGYKVRIILEANDSYTVQRVFVRGVKTTIKGEVTNVYFDSLDAVAYEASNYHHEGFGS